MQMIVVYYSEGQLTLTLNLDLLTLTINLTLLTVDLTLTRMWANAQFDGRPAEHRWRPLFNAAKFG